MEQKIQPETYKLLEAGRLLGIGRNQVYQAAKAGQIPGLITIGKQQRVVKQVFDRFLKTGKAA